jgi:hypothetical protein
MGVHSGQVVRHRNNLKLDCRRENLMVEDPGPGSPEPISRPEKTSRSMVMRFAAGVSVADCGTASARSEINLRVAKSQTRPGRRPEFLQRIDGWAAKVRSNIAPWDLEEGGAEI